MQMREKVGKSRNTVFFQWFAAPEGRKVGSLKRRVRSQLARWEMKICTPLWREAHFEVNMYKNTPASDHFWKLRCRKRMKKVPDLASPRASRWTAPHPSPALMYQISLMVLGTTLNSNRAPRKSSSLMWQAILRMKSLGCTIPCACPLEATSEPPKVVRTPGVFKILISKCASRHNGVLSFFRHLKFQKWSDNGVLCKNFDFEMWLRATTACAFFNFQKWSEHGDVFCTFWLEMCFAPQRRCQKWAKREGFVAFPTTTTTTPHYIQMHCATLQLQLQIHLDYILLHYTSHYTTLHSITLNYTTLHYTTLHYTALHYTTLHYTTLLHYLPLRFLHYTTLHSTTLQLQLHNYIPLHSTTLNYTPLHYTTLHYIPLHSTHYTTLHYTTFHYTSLHYTTLHSITLQLQLQLHNYTPRH